MVDLEGYREKAFKSIEKLWVLDGQDKDLVEVFSSDDEEEGEDEMSEGFIDMSKLTEEQKEELKKQGIDINEFDQDLEEGEQDQDDEYGEADAGEEDEEAGNSANPENGDDQEEPATKRQKVDEE